jgi:hypothetical protein
MLCEGAEWEPVDELLLPLLRPEEWTDDGV